MLNLSFNKFQCCKLKKLLLKVELGSTLCNMLLQLATPKFVARQAEHAAVIRAKTCSTCNVTMLRDKLNKNAAFDFFFLGGGGGGGGGGRGGVENY